MVRAETLMNIPDAARRPIGPAIVIPEMWMNQTRLLPPIIPPGQWMCYCYGSKLIVPVKRDPLYTMPLMIDFNPRLALWEKAGRHGTPWDPSSSYESDLDSVKSFSEENGRKDAFFQEDWISGLPFTVVTSPHLYNTDHTKSVILMIDDERLIALKVGRNQRTEESQC